jgi:Protein phosphatase 2C
MEDAYTAVPFLLEVPVPGSQQILEERVPPRIATHVRTASSAENEGDVEVDGEQLLALEAPLPSNSSQCDSKPAPQMEALHFFGVFDGHGGAEAALHCARTLHERIAEALTAAANSPCPGKLRSDSFGSRTSEASVDQNVGDDAEELGPSGLPLIVEGNETATVSVAPPDGESSSSGSDFMDCEGVLDEAMQDGVGFSSSDCFAVSAGIFESAFANAFTRTDEEFGKADNAALVGTTAVVALVGDRQLYVANCGMRLAPGRRLPDGVRGAARCCAGSIRSRRRFLYVGASCEQAR